MNAHRFRKRLLVIEALQFTDEASARKIEGWAPDAVYPYFDGDDFYLVVDTLEGRMKALPGWWIVKGVKGEFYPVDPEIFLLTYAEFGASDLDRALTALQLELHEDVWRDVTARVYTALDATEPRDRVEQTYRALGIDDEQWSAAWAATIEQEKHGG